MPWQSAGANNFNCIKSIFYVLIKKYNLLINEIVIFNLYLLIFV